MFTFFSRPSRLAALLLLLSAIPIGAAILRVFQIPLGAVPDIAAHLKSTPVTHFLHALAGASFGLLGPLQFSRVLQKKFGQTHKIIGYIFVLSGAFLALSSLHLIVAHIGRSTPVLDIARAVAGLALGASLVRSLWSIKNKNLRGHKAWMIRGYAWGMGSATIVFLYIPYIIIVGEEPAPLLDDMFFVASWAINLWIAERVIKRVNARPAVSSK